MHMREFTWWPPRCAVIPDDLAVNEFPIQTLGGVLSHPTVTRQTAGPPLAGRPRSSFLPTSDSHASRQKTGGEVLASGYARDSVCPVCLRSISQGDGLAFLRPDNRIHGACLAAAQRRAQAPSTRDAHAGEAELMSESGPTSIQGESARGSHG
jgi:hypothetical protein